jgi:alpha-tubulin suppressor-like RCC1 family protein
MLIQKLSAAIATLTIVGALSIGPVKAVTTQTSIIGGMFSSVCAIVSNGTIECWGDNANGQLGGGANFFEPVPVNYIAGTWQYLLNGGAGEHMCAIKSDGTLWCWGRNEAGQLGDNSTTNAPTPVQVGNDTTWVAGSVGYNSTCATKSNGTLWCWGDNAYGQLGNGSTAASLVPVQLTLTSVATVSVADEHACAVTTGNTLWCWGKGTTGELGDGNGTSSSSPVQVAGIWTAVTVGQTNPGYPGHTCALKSDSTLWCWGDWDFRGPVSGDSAPVEIPGGGLWTSVTSGPWVTCAIKSADASLWCWGDSWKGHLGNNTTNPDQETPQAVTGGHAWSTSVQTHDSTCGILTNLSIWCWGEQRNGAIGVADAPEENPNPLALNRIAGGGLPETGGGGLPETGGGGLPETGGGGLPEIDDEGLPETDREGGAFSGALLLLTGALAAAGVGLSVSKGSLAR